MIFVTSGKTIKDLEIQLYIDTNSTVDDCNMNSLVFNVDKIKWLNMVSKKKKPPDNLQPSNSEVYKTPRFDRLIIDSRLLWENLT